VNCFLFTFYRCNKQSHDPEPAIETLLAAQLSESEAVFGLRQLDAIGQLWSSLCLVRNVGCLDSVKSVGKLVLLDYFDKIDICIKFNVIFLRLLVK